jgi:hypothetical protein
MATGTSVSNTAYGIINDAMVDAGILQDGQQPTSDQIAKNLRRLNDIINLWQTYGLKLWLQQEILFPMTANTEAYYFNALQPDPFGIPKPSRVLQGYCKNITTEIRRPLVPLSVDEWERLGQVSTTQNTGFVNSYMVVKNSDSLLVHLWPTPDDAQATTEYCVLLMQLQSTNPVNLTDGTSFPQEWRIALRWALAEDICTGQPQAIVDRCANNARIYREQLEGWDVEDAATYLNVDVRMYQGYGRFR